MAHTACMVTWERLHDGYNGSDVIRTWFSRDRSSLAGALHGQGKWPQGLASGQRIKIVV